MPRGDADAVTLYELEPEVARCHQDHLRSYGLRSYVLRSYGLEPEVARCHQDHLRSYGLRTSYPAPVHVCHGL